VAYDGEHIVDDGAVLVTFNYRLGALGFLAHGGDGGEALRGNEGTRDQIALLRWLQRNVAAFGGDPKRVMLFGTSAGGGNICALMAAPSARGLFHAVAMQSSVPTGCELPTRADAQASTGRRVAEALGCSGPNSATCLRGKPMAEVVKAVPGSFGLFPRLYGPVVDGELIPEQPLQAIRQGRHQAVPTIIGNTSQETKQFVGSVGPVPDAASYSAAIGRVFGPAQAERIVAQYPATAFTCQSRRVARALSHSQSAPVYRYVFGHTLDNDAELKALGAVHTLEHAFFFPWRGNYKPTAADLAVQRLMLTHWTQLAAAGRMGTGPAGGWPASLPGDTALHIAQPARLQRDEGSARCDFWDTVQLPWPHL
jgi:para-nitrobenzyl esterase